MEQTVKNYRELPGLMTCMLDHKVVSTTADYKWKGPKISKDEWEKVLAFFEWTYAEAKSESQVRMFVNAVTNEWKAWAFPQRRGTGMTTEELGDDPDFKEQRARFSIEGGWYYYTTIHHHCKASAFQSGTDERNEHDQDGVHITIGFIAEKRYDFHARLYEGKWKLSGPDMSDFWDIGDYARAMLPSTVHDQVARWQMSTPPPPETAFPEEWKSNYKIPTPSPMLAVVQGGNGGFSSTWTPSTGHYGDKFGLKEDSERLPADISWDIKKAVDQLFEWAETPNLECDPFYVMDTCKTMEDDPVVEEVVRLCWLHDVKLSSFLFEVQERIEKVLKEHQEKEQKILDAELNEDSAIDQNGNVNINSLSPEEWARQQIMGSE